MIHPFKALRVLFRGYPDPRTVNTLEFEYSVPVYTLQNAVPEIGGGRVAKLRAIRKAKEYMVEKLFENSVRATYREDLSRDTIVYRFEIDVADPAEKEQG